MSPSSFRGALLAVCLVLICVSLTNCKPFRHNAKQQKLQISDEKTYKYLIKYGYLDVKQNSKDSKLASITDNKIEGSSMKNAVKKLQKYGGLKPTGILNNETITYKYLIKYGYLDVKQNSKDSKLASITDNKIEGSSMKNAVKKLQKYGGLKPTGILNNETITLMNSPRCGVTDDRVSLRFNIASYPWRKSSLTFYISNQLQYLPRADISRSIQRALDAWGVHSGLKFKEVYNRNADIIVAFARGEHGDGNPFDGRGNTLAHAFFPNAGIGGDVHFDADEPWSLHGRPGSVNFYHIALHELGHSLGLGHSENPSAVMFPWYRGFGDNLDRDDINGITKLYGSLRNQGRNTIYLRNQGRNTIYYN